ncbi:hypothetical protein TSUD_173140 [Trifolium subterraneum]|nr:hypothetical protein TSUD_173140 [Trifolium subterraneum]
MMLKYSGIRVKGVFDEDCLLEYQGLRGVREEARGASGGLLTLWDSSEVEVWSSESHEHVLWSHGRFTRIGEEFSVANVYAPCNPGAKIIDERRSSRGWNRSMDHIPFNRFIDDNSLIDLQLDWGPRPSRMLKCWKDVPGYNLFVKDKWSSFQVAGWGGFLLKEKFKMIKLALKDRHQAHTQNMSGRIKFLKDRLATLEEKGGEEDLTESEISELRGWLKEGDANTKYFHSALASRWRGNSISSLQVGSTTVEGVALIRNTVFPHFASHFKAIIMENPGAVWDCDSFKSPGPDGINFSFIKDFWSEMQGDLIRFITEFHRNGRLSKGINATFIALIPKVDSPQRLNHFRPISLVGSMYKILANRLCLEMGSVISESQTAFVKDRQIFDEILIANEGYLDVVMGRMGFPTLWRKWIKECICTATTSVIVNGSPTDEFPLERGLRPVEDMDQGMYLEYYLPMDGLWYRVLAARYGVERGRLSAGGTKGSSWWRAIMCIWDGGGEVEGGWFRGHISKKVGDGVDTCFWTDPWVEGTPLWWGEGGEAWLWCRPLRAWEEEMLGECQTLLLDISLQAHFSDSWSWQSDPVDGYIVCGAYQLLTEQDMTPLDAAACLIWHTQGSLPTKANLISRGILPVEDHLCVFGCGAVESAQHVFLSCSSFGSIWSLISSWIGSSLVTTQTLSDHFVQFTISAGGTRARRSFMQLIWLACVWVVWTERNHRLFRGSADSSFHMLDKIKTFSYRWLKATRSSLALNCHSWWSSPILCLGLV